MTVPKPENSNEYNESNSPVVNSNVDTLEVFQNEPVRFLAIRALLAVLTIVDEARLRWRYP